MITNQYQQQPKEGTSLSSNEPEYKVSPRFEEFKNKGKIQIAEPATENGKLHLKRLNQEIPKEAINLEKIVAKGMNMISSVERMKVEPYPMSYEDARLIYWRFFKEYLAKLEKESLLTKDDPLTIILPDVVKWLIGDESSIYPLNKGLCFTGSIGVGKTTLVEVAKIFTQAIGYRSFKVANCLDIAGKLEITKNSQILEEYEKGNWCFDDIGSEETKTIFGNHTDVVRHLIMSYYNRQWKKGYLPLATTNLTPQELKKRYEEGRFIDRVREMFTFVQVEGPSKRK